MPIDHAAGDHFGLEMPAHPQAMEGSAAEFLTAAFHRYGSLPPGNRVARVKCFEPFPGGNSGQKLILSVEYEQADPALHTELFAKFSRDFADPFRDRRRMELEAEIRLADLSRHPEFPVRVAKPYFADFNCEHGAGLLVTERIAFGNGKIEPLHPKCMDHLMDDALDHYEAIVTSLGKLAAAHKSGKLSPELEHLFPFDLEAAAADLPISLNALTLDEKIAGWRDFAASHPQLMPDALRSPAFFDKLREDAQALLRNERKVRSFLHEDPDLIALCHWNSNIDNAWFWRDEAGVLQCGLLDWGMVRQMNVGYSLWGGLSASEPEFLEAHLDRLLDHFANVVGSNGGPELDRELLTLHFDLSLAIIGLALMMDTPALVTDRLPGIAEATGMHDPLLQTEQVVHGFLKVSTNFLKLWADRDFGKSLSRMIG